jgi:hypothetical protein
VEKDLMQQPVEELVCGNRGEIAKLFFMFPEFPLDSKGVELLGIAGEIDKYKQEFEEGVISEEEAFGKLKELCSNTNYG